MPAKLKTMDAETLMTTPMEPLKFIVDELIPQGLTILAGAPKIGKSWLSLWICLQVSKGEVVWDFKTRKSDVLYLCLEDSFARIQGRLFEITDEAPSTLHFAIMSESIGGGLEQQIESFIKEHPDTGLIVIDTLQKIRNNVSGNVNPYAADYNDINALKQIADKHKLAIVIVHHLRKTKSSDPLNMISGTSGIAGSADTNFVLQKDGRCENTAKLICAGRDIEGRELFLEFNKDTFVWELLSPVVFEAQIIPDEISILCRYMKVAFVFTGTATELVKYLDLECKPAVLKKKIIKHIEHLKKNGIEYSENRTFERREFTLTYAKENDERDYSDVYYDSNDDMTDANSPINLPSLPSALSAS